MMKTKADALIQILKVDQRETLSRTGYRKLIAAMRLLGMQYQEMQPVLQFMEYHSEDGLPEKFLTRAADEVEGSRHED